MLAPLLGCREGTSQARVIRRFVLHHARGVCVRARARVCVCVCVRVRACASVCVRLDPLIVCVRVQIVQLVRAERQQIQRAKRKKVVCLSVSSARATFISNVGINMIDPRL